MMFYFTSRGKPRACVCVVYQGKRWKQGTLWGRSQPVKPAKFCHETLGPCVDLDVAFTREMHAHSLQWHSLISKQHWKKKNTQQGFEEHGEECGLQIPLISFQIDVMKNQISMETWFKPLKESAANRLEPDPTAHLTPGQYYYYC